MQDTESHLGVRLQWKTAQLSARVGTLPGEVQVALRDAVLRLFGRLCRGGQRRDFRQVELACSSCFALW
jgi:hypothetical protein